MPPLKNFLKIGMRKFFFAEKKKKEKKFEQRKKKYFGVNNLGMFFRATRKCHRGRFQSRVARFVMVQHIKTGKIQNNIYLIIYVM
jgi:hypothetical protein